MKKILLFGGAFDPVHKGHLAILAAAQRLVKPNLTLLVPSPDQPPHKEHTLFPSPVRARALEACLKGDARRRVLRPNSSQRRMRESPAYGAGRMPQGASVRILNFEMRGARPAYTWRTLKYVLSAHRRAQVFLLVGSDNAGDMGGWKNSRWILGHPRVTVVVGRRAEKKSRAPLFQRLVSLPGIFPKISSSRLRLFLTDPESRRLNPGIGQMIPRAAWPALLSGDGLKAVVAEYCRTHQPQSRYRHTLACARLARELALRHKADSDKAELAALLHDVSRTTKIFKTTQDAIRHAGISADIARKFFKVEDAEILESIACHTLGKPGMGLLARILFTADLASYDRFFPEAGAVRRAARRNLDAGLRLAMAVKIKYLAREQKILHPDAVKFWNSLIKT